jgi:uncharacterized protein DUF3995
MQGETIMNELIKESAGIVIAVALVIDGLFHAYWATGRVWPARDKLALAQMVLNINRTRSWRPAVLAPLACLLLCGAYIALAQVHLLGLPGELIPAPLLQIGILAIAAGLLLRGLAGVVWALGLLASKSKLFYKLNLWMYTPACIVLFIAAVIAARY